MLFVIKNKNEKLVARLRILELNHNITLYAIEMKGKYEVIDDKQFMDILEVAQKHGYGVSFSVVSENDKRN